MEPPIYRYRAVASAGLLASCLFAGFPATAGAACPPVAIVEGAAEIVTPVAAVLRRRGLRSEPSGCGRVVRASLVAKPGLNAYGLHIEDGYGRVSDREIADASTAASLIESWAIDEDADVLAPRAAPTTIARAPVAPPVPLSGAPGAFRVATRGEVASATDGSVWYGGALSACGRVGLMCLGGRARIARDGGGDGGGGLTGYLTRTRIDAGAAASLPLSRGAFTLAPAIGVGLYWTRSTANQLPLDIPVDVLANVVDDFALGRGRRHRGGVRRRRALVLRDRAGRPVREPGVQPGRGFTMGLDAAAAARVLPRRARLAIREMTS